MVGHDTVADAEIRDGFADPGHGAGHLVSEDARGGVRAGVDLLEVCTADAAGIDADEEFAGADLGDGHGFDADVVDAAVDGGAHPWRDGGTLPPGATCAKVFDCRRCSFDAAQTIHKNGLMAKVYISSSLGSGSKFSSTPALYLFYEVHTASTPDRRQGYPCPDSGCEAALGNC